MKQIAEQQVTPQLLKKIAPDVVDQTGQQKLMVKTMQAAKMRICWIRPLQWQQMR